MQAPYHPGTGLLCKHAKYSSLKHYAKLHVYYKWEEESSKVIT
jgi:hypothetical protein